MADCSMWFCDVNGNVDLSERGEQDEKGYYASNTLVDKDIDDMDMSLAIEEGRPVFFMHASHIENEKTNRVFHMRAEGFLDWHQVKNMRDFLNLLLTLEGTS